MLETISWRGIISGNVGHCGSPHPRVRHPPPAPLCLLPRVGGVFSLVPGGRSHVYHRVTFALSQRLNTRAAAATSRSRNRPRIVKLCLPPLHVLLGGGRALLLLAALSLSHLSLSLYSFPLMRASPYKVLSPLHFPPLTLPSSFPSETTAARDSTARSPSATRDLSSSVSASGSAVS